MKHLDIIKRLPAWTPPIERVATKTLPVLQAN
jgi:hypothetical protein